MPKPPAPAENLNLLRLIAQVKEGKPGAAARANYAHPYSYYAELYGRTVRQIKRYAADGLPLDNPDRMGEHLTPRGRRTAADDFAEDPPRGNPADEAPASAADQLAVRRVTILDESFLTGEGLVPAMQRISKMELALADKLQQEINKPGFNFREFSNRFGIWIGMLKTMGKIEKDAPGILEKNKNQIDVGEVQEGVTKLLLDIVGRLALIPIRCRQELAAMTDAQEIEDFVAHEISIALDPVRKCEWMPEDQRPPEVQEPPVNDTPAPVCASGPSSVKPSRRRSSSAKS